MANYEELYNDLRKLVLENRNAINGINENAKKTEDLGAASIPLAGSELVRIVQGGVSVKTTADEMKGSSSGDANVQSDFDISDVNSDAHILNKPENLSDFNNDISVGDDNVQTDWSISDTSADEYLKNKPTKLSQFTNDIQYVESFSATSGQTSHTVSRGFISDNGLWSVQVGAELWNSTSGITMFTNGNITINFGTGVITFNYALSLGVQVIIKYN